MNVFFIKSNLLQILFSVVLLSGCALQKDLHSLNNHMMALAQQNDKLEKRISELERQIALLERGGSELTAKDVRIESQIEIDRKARIENDRQLMEKFADLRVLLTGIREEIQALSGKSEMADHLLKQKTRSVEDLDRKIESRLGRFENDTAQFHDRIAKLEQYLSFEPSEKGVTKDSPEGQSSQMLSEDELYFQAKQDFDKGSFESAREGFQTLIDKHPKSKNADNAQFWIGEIYYREKWFEKAILEYQKVIEKYPNGNKVPASLLKQGLAFSNIGDEINARLILRELVNKYPKSNEAKIAGQKLKGYQ